MNGEASEIGYDRLRYGQGGCTRKEGVRIIGADQLCQWAFRCARQLRNALDRNLAHGRLILPEALDGVPGHRKGARVVDVNVRLQHLAVLDQVKALDDVKLFGVRRSESVDERPVVESYGVDDECIAFVAADGFAVPGRLHIGRMLV